jgi:hypothetical protein
MLVLTCINNNSNNTPINRLLLLVLLKRIADKLAVR